MQIANLDDIDQGEYAESRLYYEAWHKGILTWKLHGTFDKPGQLKLDQAFEGAVGKLFVGDCSRQLGKSTWAVSKCVEKAIKKKGARIRYATAFLSDLEQFIIPAFEFVLDDCPDDLKPEWRAQKSEWYFPRTKSRIRLIGLDRKPNGLRGNRLDLVVLDECGFINRVGYIYRSVLVPATTHVPDAKIIMISTQPESPDHDFVKFCDKAEAIGSYVKLTIHDNPLLLPAQIDELAEECGGYDSTEFRREYLCERVVEEGRAIVPEFRSRHVVVSPRCAANRFWRRMEALDSGVRDMTACLFGYYDFARAKVVIEHEFAIKGHEVTTKRIAELVREREAALGYGPDKYPVYRRVADNNNLILIQDLGAEYHLHFNPTDKDALHAMVNKVRLWFGADRIEIHPRCERLISACKAGIWDKNRKEFARSEVHGHFDLLAALVYFIRNVPEYDNPVPRYFGVELSDTVYQVKDRGQNRTAEIMKKAFGLKG